MADYIMTGTELTRRCIDIAQNFKTIYMYACYGFQVTTETIKSKSQQNLNGWYTAKNIAKLEKVANEQPPTWGFDCVNLIKAILWGWWGNPDKLHGGAVYASNGIPDTNADGMIKRCSGVTDDFSHIEVGEAVWMSGHIGVYVGNGLAVECTPKWKDGVQITAVWNIGKQDGFNGRKWTKHGKLPHVDYGDASTSEEMPSYALGARLLKRGCEGDDVGELQTALNKLGYNCGEVDGDFGKQTEAAVKAFQLAHELEVDGKVGPATLARIKEDLNKLEEQEKRYTVTIRNLSEVEVEELAMKWPHCEVTEE